MPRVTRMEKKIPTKKIAKKRGGAPDQKASEEEGSKVGTDEVLPSLDRYAAPEKEQGVQLAVLKSSRVANIEMVRKFSPLSSLLRCGRHAVRLSQSFSLSPSPSSSPPSWPVLNHPTFTHDTTHIPHSFVDFHGTGTLTRQKSKNQWTWGPSRPS